MEHCQLKATSSRMTIFMVWLRGRSSWNSTARHGLSLTTTPRSAIFFGDRMIASGIQSNRPPKRIFPIRILPALTQTSKLACLWSGKILIGTRHTMMARSTEDLFTKRSVYLRTSLLILRLADSPELMQLS